MGEAGCPKGITSAGVVRRLSEEGPRSYCCWRAGAELVGSERNLRQTWDAGETVALLRCSEDACVPGCQRSSVTPMTLDISLRTQINLFPLVSSLGYVWLYPSLCSVL